MRSKSQNETEEIMASASCRQPVASPANPNHVIRRSASSHVNTSFSPGEVATSLEALCEMGLLEPFRDQYNIVRYRPVEGRIV
jgi:GDP-D-mannose dehydratase